MRRISLIASLACFIFFTSCGNGGSTTASSDSTEVKPSDTTTNPTDKALNYAPYDKAADNPPADSATMDSTKK